MQIRRRLAEYHDASSEFPPLSVAKHSYLFRALGAMESGCPLGSGGEESPPRYGSMMCASAMRSQRKVRTAPRRLS